jgi:hypothetical protein
MPRPVGKLKLEVNVKGVDIPVLVRKTDQVLQGKP